MFYDKIVAEDDLIRLELSLPKTIASPPQAIYYPARIIGANFSYDKTQPMTSSEAFLWAISPERRNDYFRGTKWGLYTYMKKDAEIMAFSLGGFGMKALPHDAHQTGYYFHYHLPGHADFMGYYKRFHVWYGSALT